MTALRLVPASGPPIEVERDKATVGRDAAADVLVNDSSVSRKHARLEQWGSNWAVVDLRSANGTFLDGERVTESVLRPGQELRFGKVAYRVEVPTQDFGATVVMSSPMSDATVMQPAAAPRPPVRPATPPPSPRPPAPPPAPVPAAPVYVAPPPEPVREGKGPMFWVFLFVGGLLLLSAGGFAVVMGGAFLKSKPAVEAARAQLKEIAEGDLEAAYARNAGSYQAAHPASAFAAFVERHPGLKRNTDATFKTRSVENGKARLVGTLSHAAGTETVSYDMVNEDGEWKVADLEVDGDEAPVASVPARGGPAAGTGLTVETIAVNKTRQGQTITVKIDVRVKGFDLRPEGRAFRVDLAFDLETIGADGRRIDELSRVALETYNQTIASATDAAATFNTSLTFSRPDPGRYKAVVTIRDLVGLKSQKHEVPFELP